MSMIGFFAATLAIFLGGRAIARWLFARDGGETPSAERVAASGVLGLASWIAVLWSLALVHQLNRRNLLIALAALAIAGLTSLRGMRLPRLTGWGIAMVLPVALWTIFILWRSTVLPPQNHDAMTYHLPKAVLMVQAEGFERFSAPDTRLVAFPSNYELLLASVLVLERSDGLTEWVGTAFYLLFLVCVAMVAERWWGRGPHVAASVVAAAGMPLLLLHSGTDKNDVMTAVFACGAVFWSARWCAERGLAALVLAVVCGALTVGTKLTAGGIAPVLAPFLAVAIVRHPPRVREALATVAFAAAAFLLLGGWVFLSNATAPAPVVFDSTPAVAGVTVPPFAAWDHLWRMPYGLLRRCLGLHAEVFWPEHNVFNSHFGYLFAFSVVFLPVALWRYRDDRDAERWMAITAALLAVLIVLPFVSAHTFAAVARYSIVAVPFVVCASIAPLVRELDPRGKRVAMALILALFVHEAIDAATHDTFAPPRYLRWVLENPGTRRPSWSLRAATLVDTVAGPNDRVAFLGGADGWIYPLYGRELTRRVYLLRYGARFPEVPADAQWLVIDIEPVLGRPPTAEDQRMMEEALASGEFRRVFHHRHRNQVVLQRSAPLR